MMNRSHITAAVVLITLGASIVVAQSRPTRSSTETRPRVRVPTRTLSPLADTPTSIPSGTTSRPASNSFKQDMPDMPDNMIDIADFPPVVVGTNPPSGMRGLEPGIQKISVTYSEQMTDNSWSWSTVPGVKFPEIVSGPYYEADGMTCTIEVKLEPDTIYGSWLNSGKFLNFRDASGQAAIPYLFFFATGSE